MARLEGKVALITGAASGMGAEHSRLFVEEGAKVILADINEEAGSALAAELGENAMFLRHDVAEPASWASTIAAGSAKFGPITVLVNNAGFPTPSVKTADLDREIYLRVVAVDQNGMFFGMQAILPGMIAAGGGSVVNISSAAAMAFVPGTSNAGYTATKAAVRGMTKATAVEYGEMGIRVNSVHPGAIATGREKNVLEPGAFEAIAKTIPLRRFASSREVSYAVLFLASDESSYVTGSELVVDGGRLAQQTPSERCQLSIEAQYRGFKGLLREVTRRSGSRVWAAVADRIETLDPVFPQEHRMAERVRVREIRPFEMNVGGPLLGML